MLALCAAAFDAAIWTLRLAWADQLSRGSDPGTIEHAIRLSPGDVDFHLKLAAAQQAAGIENSVALRAATALQPLDAEAWIRLGLCEENRGALPEAERDLLRAARISRQFAPRWALANYYFRRGDSTRFWPWARQAFEIGYSDLGPLFQLCWQMDPVGGSLLDCAVPRRRDVLNAYLNFLLQQNRLEAAEPVATRLAALATSDDVPVLVLWCNRQLDVRTPAPAVNAWNQLVDRHLIPFHAVASDHTPVSDADLAVSFPMGGFAWRVVPTAGVACGRNARPRYFWLSFNGEQAESCAPLMQYLPVSPGATYEIVFRFRTAEIDSPSGLRWSVFDAHTGIDLASDSPSLASNQWAQSSLHFNAPASGVVRLTLVCRRLPGATRVAGSLDLSGVSARRVP